MMHRSRVIALLSVAVMSIAAVTAAAWPDTPYVDDVYYWADADRYVVTEPETTAPNTNEVRDEMQPKAQVIFLDDSITRQNPDTVVRVIIKRN